MGCAIDNFNYCKNACKPFFLRNKKSNFIIGLSSNDCYFNTCYLSIYFNINKNGYFDAYFYSNNSNYMKNHKKFIGLNENELIELLNKWENNLKTIEKTGIFNP